MFLHHVARLAAVALLVAACGSAAPSSPTSSTPEATASPGNDAASPSISLAASASPPSSVGPTAEETQSTAPVSTPAPSQTPTPKPTPNSTPRPTPKPTPTPVVVNLRAKDFLFSPGALHAPASRPFGIAFSNQDASIPHNVTISTTGNVSRFSGPIVTGVASVTYALPALDAGTYRVGCIVHPEMTATLKVD